MGWIAGVGYGISILGGSATFMMIQNDSIKAKIDAAEADIKHRITSLDRKLDILTTQVDRKLDILTTHMLSLNAVSYIDFT